MDSLHGEKEVNKNILVIDEIMTRRQGYMITSLVIFGGVSYFMSKSQIDNPFIIGPIVATTIASELYCGYKVYKTTKELKMAFNQIEKDNSIKAK